MPGKEISRVLPLKKIRPRKSTVNIKQRKTFTKLLKNSKFRNPIQFLLLIVIFIISQHLHPFERLHYYLQRRHMKESSKENDPYFNRVNNSFQNNKVIQGGTRFLTLKSLKTSILRFERGT